MMSSKKEVVKTDKNFTIENRVVDGYCYRFFGDIDYKDEMIKYAQMAKRFMNRPFASPLDIVGNYEWHQNFPYEHYLFPDESDRNWKILDFGCGPGRMVERCLKLFDHVDGVDISEYAVDYARQHYKSDRNKSSTFFVSSGIDIGDIQSYYYDRIVSTIAMQHIPCRTIRTNLWRAFYNSLVDGGQICIQVAYHPTLEAGVWSPDTEHASYESDFFNAKATNGHADMVINKESLPLLKEDLEAIYKNVEFEFVNVGEKYGNLHGAYHAPYWAQDWLFIRGEK